MMYNTDVHFGCPNCPEPITSIEFGAHVSFNVSATNYGAKIRLIMLCSVCGCVRDLTEHINQVSYQQLEELLKKAA